MPIYKLLEKYNNMTEVEYKTYDATYLKKFEITKLPKYLILAIKRFVIQKIAFFKNSVYILGYYTFLSLQKHVLFIFQSCLYYSLSENFIFVFDLK